MQKVKSTSFAPGRTRTSSLSVIATYSLLVEVNDCLTAERATYYATEASDENRFNSRPYSKVKFFESNIADRPENSYQPIFMPSSQTTQTRSIDKSTHVLTNNDSWEMNLHAIELTHYSASADLLGTVTQLIQLIGSPSCRHEGRMKKNATHLTIMISFDLSYNQWGISSLLFARSGWIHRNE